MDEERNPNIHLYFSAFTQDEYEEASNYLAPLPAVVRGFSFEPLLGPIGITLMLEPGPPWLKSIIVGCESGPKRSPCEIEWIESLVNQCKEAGVQCYVKQIPIDGKCVTLNKNTESIWPRWAVREMP